MLRNLWGKSDLPEKQNNSSNVFLNVAANRKTECGMIENKYIQPLLSAYLRGSITQGLRAELYHELTEKPLDELTEKDTDALISYGIEHGLKLHHFKTKDDLPRVRAVLGVLYGIQPQNLLDVGSGRGVFLFPFMREFPCVPVTSVDILPHRVEMLKTIAVGGMTKLEARHENICTWESPDRCFDVVTMLEVLEHIPDAEAAVRNAVRMARRFVIVSVPSHPDNNPEHIHLFTKDMLTEMFTSAGCEKLHFSGVNGHMILVAGK